MCKWRHKRRRCLHYLCLGHGDGRDVALNQRAPVCVVPGVAPVAVGVEVRDTYLDRYQGQIPGQVPGRSGPPRLRGSAQAVHRLRSVAVRESVPRVYGGRATTARSASQVPDHCARDLTSGRLTPPACLSRARPRIPDPAFPTRTPDVRIIRTPPGKPPYGRMPSVRPGRARRAAVSGSHRGGDRLPEDRQSRWRAFPGLTGPTPAR